MKPLVYKEIKEGLYYIEEDGKIYSLAKKDYIKQKINNDGYVNVFLQRHNGGRNNRVCYRLATLVAYTFLGPPPSFLKDPTVNHIDGNRLNNHYKNLEWMERSQNSSIRFNKPRGSKNKEAKLTEQQVYEICELLVSTNLTLTEIGDRYGVEKSTISRIYRKAGWKNITDNFDFSCRQTVRNNKGQFEVININLLKEG